LSYCEDIKDRFRSDDMRKGKSEREVVRLVMKMKMKDEKKHQRDLKWRRDSQKARLETDCSSKREFSRNLSMINREAKQWRKLERRKYVQKVNHLRTVKKIEEEKVLESCPQEMLEFSGLSIFSKEKIEAMRKEKVKVEAIGEVDLDKDEIALLSLPPKFAVRRNINEIDIQTDNELCMAKTRYQIHRERELINSKEFKGGGEQVAKRQRILTEEEIKELEEIEEIEAEGRQIYDPLSKCFDHGNKRATDCQKNKKVSLPKHVDIFSESVIQLLKDKISKTSKKFIALKCNDKGEQESNLSRSEMRGLRKLRKRIKNKEILAIKTDKSGKLTVIKRDLYEKLGNEKCKQDRVIDDQEHRRIEKRINDHVRFWTRMMNTGMNHDHLERIIASKQSESENAASKYFMFKDHKAEGGYRPVVSGCNSDTLGLSNTLSEIVEAVCMAVEDPYEVVSSEDMLSRIVDVNEKIEEIMNENDDNMYLERLYVDGAAHEKNNASKEIEYNWQSEYMLLGTDVKSLFPSLSANLTGKAVRKQISKSPIHWTNVDWKLVSL